MTPQLRGTSWDRTSFQSVGQETCSNQFKSYSQFFKKFTYIFNTNYHTHAMLMKAAFPPYRKDRLRTCRTNVTYCRGRTGMVVHTEKIRHCREVRKRDKTVERKSASFSVSPSKHGWKEEERYYRDFSCIWV